MASHLHIMFARLGILVRDYRWGVIAAWLAIAVALRCLAPRWGGVARDGDLDQLPAATTTIRAARLARQAFPNDSAKSQLVLVYGRADGPMTIEDRQYAMSLVRDIEDLNLPLAGDPWTERTPIIGEMLKTPRETAAQAVIRLSNDFMSVDNVRVLAALKRVLAERRSDAPPGLVVGVTGAAAFGGDMLSAMRESVRSTELTTVVLVAIALGLIYRSPWLAIVPLASIGVAAVVAIDLLAILAKWSQLNPEFWPALRVFTTTKMFVVVLSFGAGTDFCLFLISRFRELRKAGWEQELSVSEAVELVGPAIAASALTTIVGLSMMGMADFGKFTYSGPAIAIALAVTLAVCLTFSPALLATQLGARVAEERPGDRSRWREAWTQIANTVTGHPVAVMAASLLIGAPLAWYGLHAPVTYDLFSELPRETTSRRGASLMRQHFPAGELGPMIVLAKTTSGSLDGVAGRNKIAILNKTIYDTPGVNKVRSLYRPLGEPPGTASVFTTRGLASMAAAGSPLAREAFVSQLPDADVTRLFVILEDLPFSPRAVEASQRIQTALAGLSADPNSPWHGATFEYSGPTSGIEDLERVTQADLRRIEILVAAAVYVVILCLLRRPVLCLYLIGTVLAGYLVTLGVVSLLFQAWYGPTYPGLDWKAPIFLFVILVAVGQDYNIYLVTRVLEEQRRLGPERGLKQAIVETGGIITSCGVIMAATFASLVSGSLRGMVEIGVALSLGILLDTFVVRTLLVPAYFAIARLR